MYKYLSIILFFFVISCQDKENSQEQTSEADPVTDSLSSQFQSIYEHGNIHGFAVSVVDAEQVLYQHSFGYADVIEKKPYSLTTSQSIASITKTFLGIALLKAQELGKLNLDDPINKYLPYPIKNPYFPEDEITIRQLTNHTSSIIDTDFYEQNSYFLRNNDHLEASSPFKSYDYFNPPQDRIPILDFMKKMLYTEEGTCCRETFLNEKPGTKFQYSNGATTLAAVILELATDMSFVDFTKKHILNPLKMSKSSWDAADTDATLYYDADTVFAEYYNQDYPAGGLITHVQDLSKYLQELIKGYAGNGSLISDQNYSVFFNKQYAEESSKEDFPENENVFMQISYDQGVYMGHAPKGFVGHTGADPGTITFMFFNIKTGRGFTFITNRIIWTEFEGALNDLWEIIKILEFATLDENTGKKN